MTKKFRIIYLVSFLLLLVGLNYILYGSIRFPTGDTGIWFHGGLLMVILGTYWIEHFFTKPSDVVINGLIAFISISTLNNPPLPEWWSFLRFYSLGLLISAFFVVWLGSPAIPQNDTSSIKRSLYLLIIRLGNAKVLFSIIFILALISFFDLKQTQTRWMVVFWAVAVTFKYLDLEGFIDFVLNWKKNKYSVNIGSISRVSEPNIVRFILREKETCKKGDFIGFTKKGLMGDSDPIGIVIGHRISPNSIEVESILCGDQLEDKGLDENSFVIKIDRKDEQTQNRLSQTPLYKKVDDFIGFASRNSNISHLNFELIKRPEIEEGHLVSVPTSNENEILFQVIDGKLMEETSFESCERSFTIGEAEQLGVWEKDRQGFETYGWVIPESSPVFHISKEKEIERTENNKLLEIGAIPNSKYPVFVNLNDLVLYHTAILGVTGSGKSFLAYHLIESVAKSNIKVICLDVTGDYKRFLENPILLETMAAVRTFLDSTEHQIGVVEFTEEQVHPIDSAKRISEVAFEWCKNNRGDDQIEEPIPKVLLVFEEAHVLVPEWNSNPSKSMQDKVNETSRIALQGRKYGLGFMMITQRTANVIKSILNQCNTIFAFQAFDETGFDFMKNYMGAHYVHALPNLKKRQGVLVGKASVSDRPIIVRMHDQDRNPSLGLPETLP